MFLKPLIEYRVCLCRGDFVSNGLCPCCKIHRGGLCPRCKISRGGLYPCCKIHGGRGDYVHVYKFEQGGEVVVRGILSYIEPLRSQTF